VPLYVPSLAEHCEDVPALLSYYVDYFADRENLPYRQFSTAAQNRLRKYSWPGNIRELKNLVQRLLILGAGEDVSLEEVEAALSVRAGPVAALREEGGLMELPLREAREQFERQYLEQQFQQVGGSVGRLAQRVGMERTHLYRKLRSLGIDIKKGGD